MAADEKESAEATPAKPKKKLPLMMMGIIGGIAAAQAVGFFVFIKMFYATPAPTYGADGEHAIESAGTHGEPPKDAGHGEEKGGHGDAKASGHDAPAKGGDHGAPPKKDDGHGGGGGHGDAKGGAAALPVGKTAEVELVKKYKVPNNSRGIAYIYDFDIAMIVPGPQREHAAGLVAANQAQIYDRVGQIVRAAPARVLDEVDFRSLRLQIREALHEIFAEEDLVQQVLIPRCVPIRTD